MFLLHNILLLLLLIKSDLLGALVGTDGEEKSAKKDASPKKEKAPTKSKMEQIFGFRKEDLTSWNSLVVLLNRPTDPAGLGIFRCLFGKLSGLRSPTRARANSTL